MAFIVCLIISLWGLCTRPPTGLCPWTLLGTSIPDPLNLQTRLLHCVTILNILEGRQVAYPLAKCKCSIVVPSPRSGPGCATGLRRGADLHMAKLMPPPSLTVSCFSKIQIGFTFLVPLHPGSAGQRAVKRVLSLLLFIVCVK